MEGKFCPTELLESTMKLYAQKPCAELREILKHYTFKTPIFDLTFSLVPVPLFLLASVALRYLL
jgi:hypothetical protein